ncbi:hypothetical protein [Lacihabitans lacunae]|uniref:CRISPR-associated protein Csx10 n=1 Tax=Lacihabitans lacunae TaxID=1028214 RepID=A0ABV7YU86_9BACT
MIKQNYTCTLLSDIVLNASLATDGNMETLNFIPGANFLGIVAAGIYQNHIDFAFDILHSDKVLFGNAYISNKENVSIPMPFSLFKAKTGTGPTYIHHAISGDKDNELRKKGIQLKQERAGFLLSDNTIIKNLKKNFSLKSKQDRNTRKSEDTKMFGMESIESGQMFSFSIEYATEQLKNIVEKYLIGNKFIGKSKSAQYGSVDIQPEIDITLKTFENNTYTLVYAVSNLCFLDEKFGYPTFKPEAKDLGIEGGEICWELSQIRSKTLSTWNFKRGTDNAQRHCIEAGSVFYIKGGKPRIITKPLGEYINEGYGKVIYNPWFLNANSDGTILNELTESKPDEFKNDNKPITTALGKFLKNKQEQRSIDLSRAIKIHELVYANGKDNLKAISSSQWGEIRAKATNISEIENLKAELFTDKTGFLCHGVSAEKYWDKNKNRETFKSDFDSLSKHGTAAIAKYAAEMAKESIKQKNKR